MFESSTNVVFVFFAGDASSSLSEFVKSTTEKWLRFVRTMFISGRFWAVRIIGDTKGKRISVSEVEQLNGRKNH